METKQTYIKFEADAAGLNDLKEQYLAIANVDIFDVAKPTQMKHRNCFMEKIHEKETLLKMYEQAVSPDIVSSWQSELEQIHAIELERALCRRHDLINDALYNGGEDCL